MKIEIERKFLVASDEWRSLAVRSQHIRDGLIAASEDRKVRVRITGTRATLTVKTRRVQGSRHEFEYDIPLAHAETLMNDCGGNVLSKLRHYVPHESLVWELDEYEGILRGVVLAEVELSSIDQSITLPVWIGREVTFDAQYGKGNLLRARQKAADHRED